MSDKRMTKVAIVTGASSGIGKATVAGLLRDGYVVHAAARRLEAMKDIESQGAVLHRVDLKRSEAIRAFVQDVVTRDGRVDLLVNGAGYGAFGAVEDVPMAEAREQLDVNLFAAAEMIQNVLPIMRSQHSGRIINISSTGGKSSTPLGGWYHASKFALEGLSDSLRNEVRPFGIEVVVVEPGGVKTEWGEIMMRHLVKTSGEGAYKAIVDKFRSVVAGGQVEQMSATPEEIGTLIVRVAGMRRPKARYVAPFHAKVILFLQWLLSDRCFDSLTRKLYGIPNAL